MNLIALQPEYYSPRYNWEFANWPNFAWNENKITNKMEQSDKIHQTFTRQFTDYKNEIGWKEFQAEYQNNVTDEILESSNIEGVKLDYEQIRSSVAKYFAPNIEKSKRPSNESNLLVKIITDACENYHRDVTVETLLTWHNWLFPNGESGLKKIRVGSWRNAEMNIEQIGKKLPIYTAPPPEKLDHEMKLLIDWCNGQYARQSFVPNINALNPVIQSAIAHFWFETIHPFDDGNGRIGRNLALYVLNRAFQSSQPYHMLSKFIANHKGEYYKNLNKASKSQGDITEWLIWYFDIFIMAMENAKLKLEIHKRKVRFWNINREYLKNFPKEQIVLNKLLDNANNQVTSKEFRAMGKYRSDDVALNVINSLISVKILQKTGSGRSTKYAIIIPE